MATTLAEVAGFLDNHGWHYRSDTDRNRIMTAVESEQVEDFTIVIQVEEDGEYLALVAPQLLELKDHVFKGVAFQTLLAIAWEVELLRWEYDPRDGEVRTSTGIALADATLTEKQFNRLLSGLIQLTNDGVERLQGVLATGNDPGGKTTPAQMMAALREKLSDEGLAELQAQLQQLESEGDSV